LFNIISFDALLSFIIIMLSTNNNMFKLAQSRVFFCVSVVVLAVAVTGARFKAVDYPFDATFFWSAYQKHPATESVIDAILNSTGDFPAEALDFVVDAKRPIDEKIAVINALTESKVTGRTEKVYEKLMNVYQVFPMLDEEKLSADHLLVLGYITALDAADSPTEGVRLTELAAAKRKDSYTFQVIAALCKAQQLYQDDKTRCQAYQVYQQQVEKNKKLKLDMKPEAITILNRYLGGLSGFCK
jgi:hypothetical protein